MKAQKTYYYSHTHDDEFMAPPQTIKSISGDYVYVKTDFKSRLYAFIAYRLIAMPIAFVHTRLFKRIKVVNKQALTPYLNDGYFIFANHTQIHSDAFAPTIVAFPKRLYTIVNANNVSLPGLGNATKLLGALPLPDDLQASKNFIRALKKRLDQGYGILIYPEAHIWPYFTGIRNFADNSFKYPIKHDVPSFSFTTTYQKRRNGRLKLVMYVDGPFYSPLELDKDKRQSYLHALVSNKMKERASLSNYQKYQYHEVEKL
ncbi:MAG TPA: 1-acyl-sn-glycerol-3-phosphate acyltransferase [Bacilli bacterium]|nr:1-acyl-sn-glycerol-3-phosphate acyltransferase [Bacilli bacterium]